MTEKSDRYHEALTMAEAGQQEQAIGLIAKENSRDVTPPKLIVVGRESSFSKEIVDYALEMAQRMSYQILALNTAPLSSQTFQLFSSSRSKLCEEFRTLSEENVRAFRLEAEKMGIPFSHVVEFCEPDEAIEAITRKFRDIEFVVSESEEDRVANREEQGERPRHEIYVYSMM
ncbi:MAG: hypothetical protein HY788_09050 [Deltaproteobacteria bacterium]|nr:hypothetical protein [Deltaproteobacteria bacterium]